MPGTAKSPLLTVKVQPGAKRNEILRFDGDILHLRVTAPPVEGKANTAVIALLSKVLPSYSQEIDISLTQGQKAKLKVFSIEGANLEEIKKKMPSAVRE